MKTRYNAILHQQILSTRLEFKKKREILSVNKKRLFFPTLNFWNFQHNAYIGLELV